MRRSSARAQSPKEIVHALLVTAMILMEFKTRVVTGIARLLAANTVGQHDARILFQH